MAEQPTLQVTPSSLQRSTKFDVSEITNSLGAFAEKQRGFALQKAVKDAERKAGSDVERALRTGETLQPQKERLFEPRVAQAYNETARNLFKVNDLTEYRKQLSEIQVVAETTDMPMSDLQKQMDDLRSEFLSARQSDPLFGDEYVQELAPALFLEQERVVDGITVQRKNKAVKQLFSDAVESYRNLQNGLRDVIPNKEFLTELSTEGKFSEFEKRLSEVVASSDAYADYLIEQFGAEPILLSMKAGFNDDVADNIINSSVEFMQNELGPPGVIAANKLIEQLNLGRFKDKNSVKRFIRLRNEGKGDINLDVFSKRFTQMQTVEGFQSRLALSDEDRNILGLPKNVGRWNDANHILRSVKVARKYNDADIKGGRKALSQAVGSLRGYVAIQLALGNDLSNMSEDPDIAVILKNGVHTPHPDERSEDFDNTAKIVAIADRIKNNQITDAELSEIAYRMSETPTAPDPTTFTEMTNQFVQSQGDARGYSIKLRQSFENVLLKAQEVSKDIVPREITKGAADNLSRNVLQLWQGAANGDESSFAMLTYNVDALQKSITDFDTGVSANPFLYLAGRSGNKEFSRIAPTLDAVADLRRGGAIGEARILLDASIKGRDVQPSELPAEFFGDAGSMRESKTFTDLNSIAAAYNFGLPNKAMVDTVMRAIKSEAAADFAATGKATTWEDYADRWVTTLQSSANTRTVGDMVINVPRGKNADLYAGVVGAVLSGSGVLSPQILSVVDPVQLESLSIASKTRFVPVFKEDTVSFYLTTENGRITPLRLRKNYRDVFGILNVDVGGGGVFTSATIDSRNVVSDNPFVVRLPDKTVSGLPIE